MASQTVELRRLDSVPLAVIRRQVRPADLSRVIPECCGLVWHAVRAQKAPAGRHVALYWDFDSTVRLEVGVELLGAFAEEGDIVRSATPSGLVASATHFGPYGGLRAAHDAVHEWCTSNNQRVAGPSWEIYGHWLDEWNGDPSRIRTDVFYLLR
jgi:effector-binding domain-containing protein